ncbi:MAG: MFS transporter [Synechococcales cyanobacterium RM1_1_8]|nr:MFS transporter [Synechococcales cyanobacterium RM1_1_8]
MNSTSSSSRPPSSNLWAALTPFCRRNLMTLFGAGILFWASLTMFLPTLPLYIKDIGGNPAQVGQVIGGFTIGLLLFRPYLARLADRKGRKPVLLLGIAAVALAPLGYLLTDRLGLLFAVRVFHGLSVAGVTLAYAALVADLAPLAQRAEVLSYMSLTTPTGMSLGPALGSTLLERWGYGPLFWTAATLGLLGFGLALGVYEPPRPRIQSGSGHNSDNNNGFWRYLRSPAVRIPTLMMLLIGLAFGTLMTFTALYLKQADQTIALLLPFIQLPGSGLPFQGGLAVREIPMTGGLFFSAAAMTGFVLRLFAGMFAQRLGLGLLMSLGIGTYGVAMVMLCLARSPEMFLLAAIVEGGGFGLLIPMLSVLLANRSRPEQRGRIFGICLLGLDLGGAIAAPLFGAIATQFGYQLIFALGAAMVFAALLLFLTRANADLASSLRFALGRGADGYALIGPAEPEFPGIAQTGEPEEGSESGSGRIPV